MRNLILELTRNAEKYDYLLSNTIIKLVPMINPDGVTVGNARTSLVGVDLNRRWGNPNSLIHPEVFFLKAAMQEKAN